ncbi:MAG: entericidin A/B family lipoprotein [Phycisphaerales bacterium]|jgi:predicted small secreted protein
MIRRILLGIILSGMILAFAGCNTIRGMGEDITLAGEAISEAASMP